MNSPGSGWTSGLFMRVHPSAVHARPRTSGRLQQHDQQREHFRQNRHAFEQEERQVDRAGDLAAALGWRAMPSAAAAASLPMPRPAPITIMPRPSAAPKQVQHARRPPAACGGFLRADDRAVNDRTQGRRPATPTTIALRKTPALLILYPSCDSCLSDEREWPCR